MNDAFPGAGPVPGHERFKVLSNSEVAPGAYVLRFQRDAMFRPGQMVGLTTDPSISPRFYTVASGTGEPFFEILFTRVEGGALTPALSAAKPGDDLWVSAPSGSFVDTEEPSWWIANGTGVAPFASMVRSGLAQEKTLIHGSRTLSGFYYADLFRKALGGRYVRCSSGERGEDVYGGRLTAWLEISEAPADGTKFLLCGSSAMIVEVRDILIGKGVPYDRILSEIYF